MESSSSFSTKSTSSHGWTYDVFLSFAGKDTRKGFVGHLYRALDDKGLYTFRDDLQLRMGDSISDELLKCIEESRFAVVVFSEKYADSSWCLDELVKIMDCRKLIGQTVIPVFYNVDPSNIRRQTGVVFEEAFRKFEARYENDLEKVLLWKKALFEAASISGCDVSVTTANGNESDCIIKIVQEISSKCRRNSKASKNLVGIIPRVQEVISLLDTTSNDVQMIGIWGMGGAGKTTLAWAVYNEMLNQFHGSSYVANIREVSKCSGLHFLQGKVLSELLSERNMKVTSDLEGIELMATRLRRKKILLVLDDVDDDGQLDALAGDKSWFGMGSRIIITTRDKHCLKKSKVNNIYKFCMLDNAEAIQLFSLYAFERSNPPEGFKEHVDQVADYAAGLPLALKVLGSFLCDRSITEWKSTLERLEVTPEDKVNEILKISFDGLRETEQRIFLDIACFFKGKQRRYVTRILNSFGLFAEIGISILIQKSLLSVSKRRLSMHDRVQEMGWHIVRKVSNKPGEHSRLWLPNDVYHVLASKKGTGEIEGIRLDLTDNEEDISFSSDTFESMNELRLLYFNIENNASKFQMLQKESKWFSKGICNLLSKCFTEEKNHCPSNKLQWLTWNGYLSDALPESFLGAKLVGLELLRSNIIQLWKGRKNLDKLRFINLSFSRELKSTPDFEGTPNLESLILDGCKHLVDVHPSIRVLKQLAFLSLDGCKKLVSLPCLTQMKSLETLILSNCKKLKFLEFSGNMETLLKLYLNGTSIEELPSSVSNLTGLVFLNLKGCKYLTSLPETICRLRCVKTLVVSSCTRLEKLPKNFGKILSLEELFLDNTPIKEPPLSMVNQKNLKTLSMDGCKDLMSSLLLKISPDSFKLGSELPLLLRFEFIKKLIASKCNLEEGDFPDDLSPLFSLEELDLSENPFSYLPSSISQLPRLGILDVSFCSNLQALDSLPSSIAILKANYCGSLKTRLDFTKYESLWKLSSGTSEGFWENSPNLVLQSLLQGHLIANHRLSILVPGYKIPEWFTHNNKGHYTNLQLPSNWYNGSILGFAICAVFNNLASRMTLRFDLVKEKMEDFKLTPPTITFTPLHHRSSEQLWLGFVSIDFFKLLFPQLKPDFWSKFEGNLCMQLHDDLFYCENQVSAIRLVYKEDVEEGTYLRNLAGVFNDPTGRPWLEDYPDDDNDDDDQEKELDELSTAYLKKTGSMGAKISFHL